MHVQILSFDGPRSHEMVEASGRAGRERISPLIESDPDLRTSVLGGFRALGPDGTERVVVLAVDEAALDGLERLVTTSELLPGEDPALLPAPSRSERYAVDHTFGRLTDLVTPVDS